MKKRLMVFFMLLALLISTLTGCDKAGGKQKVVLNEVAHSIFYAPLYVAIENGYFREQGITLELVTGFGADKTMTALLSKEADIGLMGGESTIYTYQNGMQDYAVNFAQLTQRAGNFMVARQKDDSFTYDKLKGKTVLGGRPGGMPEMVFEYILKKHGIDPQTDLTIDQSIDFGSTAAAFSSGQGDYTVEFEPHATALEEKGDGVVVSSLGKESGYVPYTSFSARQSFLAENPETIQAFTDALQKGMEYVNTHTPAEIAKSIAPQFSETEISTLETIVKRYKDCDSWKKDLIFEKDSFTLLQDILMDAGTITERAPYEDLVNTAFAQSASNK